MFRYEKVSAYGPGDRDHPAGMSAKDRPGDQSAGVPLGANGGTVPE